jgi:K+-sensing histidine kinase KdpD
MIEITESFTTYAYEQNKEVFVCRNLNALLNEIICDYISDDFKTYILGDKKINVLIKYVSLKRALGNIILNANKYSKNLYISSFKKDKKVVIIFEDDGSGIDEKTSDIIFSPFTKQNTTRIHGHEGIGLGLSIARDAIIAHGGEISACNSKAYGGACLIVTIPLQP